MCVVALKKMDQHFAFENLPKSELLALAKARGFKKISSFNKHDLARLLITGKHLPKFVSHNFENIVQETVHSSRGLKPFEIEMTTQYGVTISSRGLHNYLVRGIDLDGMFQSVFVEDSTIRIRKYSDSTSDDDDDTSDDDDDDKVTIPVNGGWVVPSSVLPELKLFLQILKLPRHHFNSDDRCSVCLELYSNNDIAVKLNCNHVFHVDCMNEWIRNNKVSCPLCRIQFKESLDEHERQCHRCIQHLDFFDLNKHLIVIKIAADTP